MSKALRVLFAEDREEDALLVQLELKRAGYQLQCTRVQTRAAMQQALEHGEWDMIISDFSMPQFDAVAALNVLKESGLDLPFIIVSGTVGEDTAVHALKLGAHDFIPKTNLQRLVPAVARALREAAGRRARRHTEEHPAPAVAQSAEVEEPVAQAVILVVEDELSIRQLVVRVLERAGYRVVAAGDSEEALALLNTHPGIDLMLTDIMLPHMNGKDLARRVREIHPLIAIVYMSGYADEEIDLGAAYLEKPFTPQELLSRLREELTRIRG